MEPHAATYDGKSLPKDLGIDIDAAASQVPPRGDRSEMRASKNQLDYLQTHEDEMPRTRDAAGNDLDRISQSLARSRKSFEDLADKAARKSSSKDNSKLKNSDF